MAVEGLVFDVKRYSVHDGPGIRTTFFLKGCPLKCRWCHNPESISPKALVLYSPARCIGCDQCVRNCPNGALSYSALGIRVDHSRCVRCGQCVALCPTEALEMTGELITPRDVLREALKDRLFYDESRGGVTFSGGEPLMQHDFLRETLKLCGDWGIHRGVDTTGYAPTQVVQEIASQTDLFLYDLKHMDSREHKKYTGVDNHLILKNLQELARLGAEVNIRIPFIPGVNSSEENIRRTGEFIVSLSRPWLVSLLPYHGSAQEKYRKIGEDYSLKDLLPPSEHQMRQGVRILENYGLTVKIGG